MEADAETLWAEIRELARNYDYPFAARILEVGEHEHWTVMHVALALAHAHMELSNNTVKTSKTDDGVHEPIIMTGNCRTAFDLARRVDSRTG